MKYKKEFSPDEQTVGQPIPVGPRPEEHGEQDEHDAEIIRLKTLQPMLRLGTSFISASAEEQIYAELLEAIDKGIGGGSLSLMMADQVSDTLKVVAVRNIEAGQLEILERAEVKIGERVSGWVYQSATPLILNRGTQDNSVVADRLSREELSAAISFPLIGRGEVLGVINVSQTVAGAYYSEADLELVSVLSRLAVLAIENIRLAKHREEAVRVRTLFEQYVSPEVAGLLMEQKSELLNLGSVRELTILFADIRNFTALVQNLDLQTLRLFLNDFFTRFTACVFENRGTLDKFMGDAALVIFGAPAEHDNPNVAAVTAAVAILREFQALRSHWSRSDGCFADIGLGIGISCGEMFIGNVGSSRRLDYTVIGSEVNIAQRLASDCPGDSILITEPIRTAVADTLIIRKTEKKKLRGLPGEIIIHTIDHAASNGR